MRTLWSMALRRTLLLTICFCSALLTATYLLPRTLFRSQLSHVPIVHRLLTSVDPRRLFSKHGVGDPENPLPTITGREIRTRANMWITAYYTVWGVCDLPPERIEWSNLTHIVHQQLEPSTTGRLWKFPHAFHDDDTLYFERGRGTGCPESPIQLELIHQAHAHGVKVLLGLGGAGKGAEAFRTITREQDRTETYVENVLRYARDKGYDGVDVDWEFVVSEDEAGFIKLLQSLRNRLNQWKPRGLLTIAIPGWTSSEYGYNATVMNSTADQINVMSYDLSNQWSTYTGFNAPARHPRQDSYDGLTMHGGITAWVNEGLDRSKLGLGLPFYGYYWDENDGPGQLKRGNTIRQISYGDVHTKYASARYHWDDDAKVPWLSGSDSMGMKYFISFEDEKSLAYKVQYAKAMHLGGVMIFELWRGLLPRRQEQPLLSAVRKAAWSPLRPVQPTSLASRHDTQGIILRWNTREPSPAYRVQINKTKAFPSKTTVDTLVSTTSITIRNLRRPGKYYWRVRGEEDTLDGRWSAVGSFTNSKRR